MLGLQTRESRCPRPTIGPSAALHWNEILFVEFCETIRPEFPAGCAAHADVDADLGLVLGRAGAEMGGRGRVLDPSCSRPSPRCEPAASTS